ncbi:hypothetical protein Csa_022830 [Cucumis sativus]|uniref:Uncharacterized protein n=1 Tax=Cucumis sativus TaxID=3659 RepID=A0A0A0LSN7_CUCSA|nr:hypothetical protein Csa_022830 [Cucumis sativus]
MGEEKLTERERQRRKQGQEIKRETPRGGRGKRGDEWRICHLRGSKRRRVK